ncbi:RICIN domain-containing protein [Streptomyces sp. NPDC093109]|uniref:RICIN domain-containing protein n=1 Tax=Streptomyces sp. NPDC093109 TaxID=3154977 RepID=UPI00344D4C76
MSNNEFPEGHFFIRNVFSGKVLDIADSGNEPGSQVVVADRKSSGFDSQLWRYDSGLIINKGSGLVLQVPGYEGGGHIEPGTALRQAAKQERALNQLWACNYQMLMPYDPAVAITGEGGKFVPGTNAVVDKYEMGDSKVQWTFETP